MSGIKPVGTELLYSYYQASTVSTPTASPGSSMIVGYPPVVVPAGYMGNTGNWSSSLKLKMGGLLTTTATIPSWQFMLYAAIATTSAPAFSSSLTLGSTAALAAPTAQTNMPWFADIDIGLRTLALGAASTVVAMGEYRSVAFASTAYAVATPNEMTMPTSGAYTPFATWDTTQAYVLWPALLLGAGTAGNTVTTQYCKLYGEN